ncbi:MAG: hypothetical protein GF418_11365, partial [Chitinivibrionales bacterium]|nr:hypothetical protein [Chitinivibrionales bacterium]MBD3396214.1 hypothetical protein [Chitinivibrionales bacterium]
MVGEEATPEWTRTSLGPVIGAAITETKIYVGTGGNQKLLAIGLNDGQ